MPFVIFAIHARTRTVLANPVSSLLMYVRHECVIVSNQIPKQIQPVTVFLQTRFLNEPLGIPNKIPPDFRSNIQENPGPEVTLEKATLHWQRWENQSMIMGWSSEFSMD